MTSKYGVWNLTDLQVEKIKSGNLEAINSFYLDNIKTIKKKAFSFSIRHCQSVNTHKYIPSRYCMNDMLQQAYVDLPLFDYKNSISIGLSLYYCFKRTDIGGYSVKSNNLGLGCLILDKTFDNHSHRMESNTKTLLDLIPSPSGSAEDIYINSLEESVPNITIRNDILDQFLKSALSSLEYKVMRYLIFTNYTDYDISDILGLTHWNIVERIRGRASRTLANNFHFYIDQFKTVSPKYYNRFRDIVPKNHEKVKNVMQGFAFSRG